MLKSTETAKRRNVLGQGLNALIPEPLVDQSASDRNIVEVPIELLLPNPYQPRRTFIEESLEDLSRSIKEIGVIQPLIVRSVSDGKYEIVAGERRWRAAGMAGLPKIPAIVRKVSDSESLEIALIENLQRENLNALDTAEAYDLLIEKFSYTHEALAKRIGKDRSNITNYIRLLKLPDPVKEFLRQDQLSMGHARTLLAVEHMPTQLSLSQKVVRRKLSVRELERIVQNYKKKQEASVPVGRRMASDISPLETALSRHFATRVVVRQKTDGSGKLEVNFHSREELERLLESMGYSEDSKHF